MKRNTKGVGMKKWVIIGALVVLFSGGLCGMSQAQVYDYNRSGVSVRVDLDIDTSTALGSVYHDSVVASKSFWLPFDAPIYLKIVAMDTSSVEGKDTLIFALQTSVEMGDRSDESVVSDWLNVTAWSASTNGTDYPLSHYLPLDSIRLGSFPVGGWCRFVVYQGSVEDATVTTGRWEFDCYAKCGPYKKAGK